MIKPQHTMKRFLFFISALAALWSASGCSREVADTAPEGDFVNATFNVSLPGDIATKAISDGTLADELRFIAFDENGRQISGLEQTIDIVDRKATLTAKLIRGFQYTFAFWAQKKGRYAISYVGTDTEHPYIVITTEHLPDMMNNDDFDAFYARVELKKDADFEENVNLTRPFAQINLAIDADDCNAAIANGLDIATAKSAFAFQAGINNRLRLADGAIDKTQDCTGALACTAATVPGDNITIGSDSYTRIAMLYVLAPGDEPANLDLTVTVNAVQNGDIPVEISKEIKNVPVRRNYRTNIVGKLFTIGGTFNVTVSTGFVSPDNTVDLTPPAAPTEFVAEKGQDYLAANNDGDLDDIISYNNSTSYNNAVSELRIYKTQDLCIEAKDGYTIKKIELTCTGSGTAKYGPGCWGTGAPDGYTYESSGRNGTWLGSAQSVMFTASGDQVRISYMKVTYIKD